VTAGRGRDDRARGLEVGRVHFAGVESGRGRGGVGAAMTEAQRRGGRAAAEGRGATAKGRGGRGCGGVGRGGREGAAAEGVAAESVVASVAAAWRAAAAARE
jgi:hypothetical protein